MLDQMASNKRLALVGHAVGMHHQLVQSDTGMLTDVAMGTIVEAVFGALYVDSGMDMRIVNAAFKTLGLHKPAAPRLPVACETPDIENAGPLATVGPADSNQEGAAEECGGPRDGLPFQEVPDLRIRYVESERPPELLALVDENGAALPPNEFDPFPEADAHSVVEDGASFSASRPTISLTQDEHQNELDHVVYAPWSPDLENGPSALNEPRQQRIPYQRSDLAVDVINLAFAHATLEDPAHEQLPYAAIIAETTVLPPKAPQHPAPRTRAPVIRPNRQVKLNRAFLLKQEYPRLAAKIPVLLTKREYRGLLAKYNLKPLTSSPKQYKRN